MRNFIKLPLFFLLFLVAFFSVDTVAQAQSYGHLLHGPWTEWSSGTTFNHILKSSDGGYLLSGTSFNRGVLVKLDDAGFIQWSKLIKGGGYQRDTSMIASVEAPNGDFVVTCQVYIDNSANLNASAEGSWDIYVMRLTSQGAALWEKTYARKNVGVEHPDTTEYPQFIYKNCAAPGLPCTYIVTGAIVYSAVLDCVFHGYRSAQALVLDESGKIQNDLIMAGPSATGDGAVKTIYTSDGNFLVLTEQAYANTLLYTTGLQKYGPTGKQLWSKSYYEVFHKSDGDHLLKISAGSVVEVSDGYIIGGSTYYSYLNETPLGAYYTFKVDKATGASVAWNRKFRAWVGWDSLWVLGMFVTPDGGFLGVLGDGVTTANDKIFRAQQNNGSLSWVNEYGVHLGAIAHTGSELDLTSNAYDALFAKLSSDGHIDEMCKALPVYDKTAEATESSVYKTEVGGGFPPSGCNLGIGKASAYAVSMIEAGEYHLANQCAPYPQVSASRSADFGSVSVGVSAGDIEVSLSNYSGLSSLVLSNVELSTDSSCSIISDTCSRAVLYPVNAGTPTACSVFVRFTPASSGPKECTLNFPSNYESPLSQTLKGVGLPTATPTGTATPLPSSTATPSPTPTGPVINTCFSIKASVARLGGGSVLISPKPNCKPGKYRAGTSLTIRAVAKRGYKFKSWSGGVRLKTAKIVIPAAANLRLVASFRRK